jgi:hypothetical protein
MELTSNEINQVHELLKDYTPAHQGIETLERHKGNLETSFDELWVNKNGQTLMPPTSTPFKKSLWETTLDVLREELCGDDGFRARLSEYTKSPESAVLITALIGYVLGTSGLPIDPSIATIIIIYILKVGLNIYCEYIEPDVPTIANAG